MGEIDTGYLSIPKMQLIHIIAFNFKHLFIYDALATGGQKTFKHLLPYLLLVHIGELLVSFFLPFSLRFLVGMVLDFIEHLGLIQTWLSVT